VLASVPQRGGHGPFIQATGRDDRLGRTAMAQPREDGRPQIDCHPQPIERGALRGGEGLATERTAIPQRDVARPPNVSLPHVPSGRALEVMAA
jgi:hypothetical protein